MENEITKKIEITIKANGNICMDDCIFRSIYVNSFCKLYKKELEAKEVLNRQNGIVKAYCFKRLDECLEQFGKNKKVYKKKKMDSDSFIPKKIMEEKSEKEILL